VLVDDNETSTRKEGWYGISLFSIVCSRREEEEEKGSMFVPSESLKGEK